MVIFINKYKVKKKITFYFKNSYVIKYNILVLLQGESKRRLQLSLYKTNHTILYIYTY